MSLQALVVVQRFAAAVVGGTLLAGCVAAPHSSVASPVSPGAPAGDARALSATTSFAADSEALLEREGESPQQEEQQQQEESEPQSPEIAIGGEVEATDYVDTDPSALTEFKPVLDGHGAWVEDASYGTLWVPSRTEVGADFVPYTTAGHWTYDDAPRTHVGWVWVSDYAWGWAPFHYGRWTYVNAYGWAWIPGRTYAGAWVSWRTGPGYEYIGWAPLGPTWYWRRGFAIGWTFGGAPRYAFCHRDYIYGSTFSQHVIYGVAARPHEVRTQVYVPLSAPVGAGGVAGKGQIREGVYRSPTPRDIGIRDEKIVRPPSDDVGLHKAQALAVSPPRAPVVRADTAGAAAFFRDRGVAGASVNAPFQRSERVVRGPSEPRDFSAFTRQPAHEGVPVAPPPARFRIPDQVGAASPSQSAPPFFRAPLRETPAPIVRRPPAPVFRSPTPVTATPVFRFPPPAVAAPVFRAPLPVSSPVVRQAPRLPVLVPSRPTAAVLPPSFRAAPVAPTPPASPPGARSQSLGNAGSRWRK